MISADIQANIEELPSNTFEQCSKLQNIKLPESLKRISNNTFINCSLLEEITIPDAVTVIDDKAFEDCIYNHRTTKTNQKYPSVNL